MAETVGRCTALAWTGKPGQLVVRCIRPAGHPGSHVENLTRSQDHGHDGPNSTNRTTEDTMETVTIGQHVTIASPDVNPRYADVVWTVEWTRTLKDGTPVAHLVSTADARLGKGVMRRLDSVPVAVLAAAE